MDHPTRCFLYSRSRVAPYIVWLRNAIYLLVLYAVGGVRCVFCMKVFFKIEYIFTCVYLYRLFVVVPPLMIVLMLQRYLG